MIGVTKMSKKKVTIQAKNKLYKRFEKANYFVTSWKLVKIPMFPRQAINLIRQTNIFLKLML